MTSKSFKTNWTNTVLKLLFVPIMVMVIHFYQRQISARKGYKCAHQHHGGLSCSAHALYVLEHDDFISAITKILARRKACHITAREHGFSYRKLYIKSGVTIVALSALTGCGGSGGGTSFGSSDNTSSTSDTTATINLTVNENVLPESNDEYFVIVDDESQSLDSNNLSAEVESDDYGVVGVSDEEGTPYLLAWKHPNVDKVDISLESTAVVFFLKRPQLAGVQFSDTQAVENRIKNHKDFSKLVQLLETEIKTSPCPLDPFCSTQAMILSDSMFEEMDFSDLVKQQ